MIDRLPPEAAPSSPALSRHPLRWPHKLLLGGFGVLVALLLAEGMGRSLGLLPTLSDAARAVRSAVNGDDSPASTAPETIQPADLAHLTAIPQPLEVIFSEPGDTPPPVPFAACS